MKSYNCSGRWAISEKTIKSNVWVEAQMPNGSERRADVIITSRIDEVI